MSNFEVRHYLGNGIVAQETTNFTLKGARIEDTGLYGVYPVRSSFVRVEGVEVILNSTRAQAFERSLFSNMGVDPHTRV